MLEQSGERMLLVIGLNSITADETYLDPTMRKVREFAEDGGYDGLICNAESFIGTCDG